MVQVRLWKSVKNVTLMVTRYASIAMVKEVQVVLTVEVLEAKDVGLAGGQAIVLTNAFCVMVQVFGGLLAVHHVMEQAEKNVFHVEVMVLAIVVLVVVEVTMNVVIAMAMEK